MNDLLTIGLTGDVMLGRTMDQIMDQKGCDYPWGNLLGLMNASDVNIINLETTLTSGNVRVEKTFNFKAAPDKVKSLKNANVTIANLANNHVLDFDVSGLLETMQTLDSAGIKHTGAGKNHQEASDAVIVRKKGILIGVVGMTDNEPEWEASREPGTYYVNPDDESQYPAIVESLENLRKKTDLLIVSVHWGPNMREEPSHQFTRFAHLLCDHGADVVHGHSAHIFQALECYGTSLILYDTGDFVDDYAVDPQLRNDLSAYFILTAKKSGLASLRIVPTRIHSYQVNQAVDDDYRWVIARMQYLSSRFQSDIDDEGHLQLHHTTRTV